MDTPKTEITLEDTERADKLVAAMEVLESMEHRSYETEPYRQLPYDQSHKAGRAEHAAKVAHAALFDYLLTARHAPGGEFANYALRLQERRLDSENEFSVRRDG